MSNLSTSIHRQNSKKIYLACDSSNDRLNFRPFPIYGILCDGTTPEFFSFDGRSQPLPTFSCGVFRTYPYESKPLKGSTSQITMARQILTTFAAYGLSARSCSTFCSSLTMLESKHIWNAPPWIIALDRVLLCLFGKRHTALHLGSIACNSGCNNGNHSRLWG